MRGADVMQESLFTTVHLESFVPADHPIRPLRDLFNLALQRLSGLFDGEDRDKALLKNKRERRKIVVTDGRLSKKTEFFNGLLEFLLPNGLGNRPPVFIA